MSATARDAPGRDAQVTSTREPKLFEIAYTLGSSGDPATGTQIKRTDVACTLVRTGAGLFTFTVPAWPANCQADVWFTAIQPAPTVATMTPLTMTPSTGTITVRFSGNALGTPVDFTSGDQLQLFAQVDSKGDT